MREAGKRLAAVMAQLRPLVRPGASTLEIDQVAERLIRAGGDIPSFKNYHGYSGTICASVNDEVVHGIPSATRILREGDIIGIDIGLSHRGWHSDMAESFAVGSIDPESQRLLDVTRKSLVRGIAQARAGRAVNAIGSTVQTFVETAGFNVVRDLVGHGIGQHLHEDPAVPNFGHADAGPLMVAGMTLAVEPMVTAGDWHVREDADGWTIRTEDGSRSAHFEHTILVTESGCEVLTG